MIILGRGLSWVDFARLLSYARSVSVRLPRLVYLSPRKRLAGAGKIDPAPAGKKTTEAL